MDAFRLIQSSRILQNDHIMKCVDYFRKHPIFRVSSLVFIPENAPGSRGGEIAHTLAGQPAVVTMSEFGKDKRPGVPKDGWITQNMVKRMKKVLTEDFLHLAADMTTYPGKEATEEQREAMIDQLCHQLLAFKFKQTNSVHGKYSGKDGVSGRDDSAVAALMPLYWAEVFCESDEYFSFRKEAYQRLRFAL